MNTGNPVKPIAPVAPPNPPAGLPPQPTKKGPNSVWFWVVFGVLAAVVVAAIAYMAAGN